MHSNHYKKLVEGYIQKTLNKEELDVFFYLLEKGDLDSYIEKDMDLAIAEFDHNVNPPKNKNAWIKYVAAIIIIGGLTLTYFYTNTQSKVEPGKEHAILTMADGTKIVLDTLTGERLQVVNGIVLKKDKQGGIMYDLSQMTGRDTEKLTSMMSSIETPNGGTYQLILSDGTKVWLNAGSKLKFPMIFNDKYRKVEMEGEVFFEVARRIAQPFIVTAGKQEIKVLGTVFNVDAYEKEIKIKTTLVEGSVAIRTLLDEKIIKPGQEAEASNNAISIKEVDADQAIAWKNGYFKFDKLKVSEMMPKIERWYNIEVVYSPEFQDERFVAKIKRSASIEELIAIFNAGGLEAKLEGRKLIVSNIK